LTKTASGKKLMLLNTFVSATAGACASFCNTAFMRKAEVDKGIQVCSDLNLENNVGVSKLAAKAAVTETALSRSAMSLTSVCIPAIMILTLGGIGIRPTGKVSKNTLDVLCIALALRIGLPFSVSIFPPLSIKKGTDLEKEFH